MQLSKLENEAYEKLRTNNLIVFRPKDMRLLLNISRAKAYNIIKALKRKEAIKKAGKRFLSLKETSEFVIAQAIVFPSYISFWSALSYYGFSDQTPKKIFLATTKYSKEMGNFKYVTLSKKRFFGYISMGNIVMAEKEKAIIDSLLFPKYAGGIKEIIRSISSAKKQINIKKLISYAKKTGSRAAIRRLGFILEKLNYKEKGIQQLKKNIGKGPELLDPSLKRKNNINKTWMLDINC